MGVSKPPAAVIEAAEINEPKVSVGLASSQEKKSARFARIIVDTGDLSRRRSGSVTLPPHPRPTAETAAHLSKDKHHRVQHPLRALLL